MQPMRRGNAKQIEVQRDLRVYATSHRSCVCFALRPFGMQWQYLSSLTIGKKHNEVIEGLKWPVNGT